LTVFLGGGFKAKGSPFDMAVLIIECCFPLVVIERRLYFIGENVYRCVVISIKCLYCLAFHTCALTFVYLDNGQNVKTFFK